MSQEPRPRVNAGMPRKPPTDEAHLQMFLYLVDDHYALRRALPQGDTPEFPHADDAGVYTARIARAASVRKFISNKGDHVYLPTVFKALERLLPASEKHVDTLAKARVAFFAQWHMDTVLGFGNVRCTGAGPDAGIDVMATDGAAQVKHYTDKLVSAPKVLQARGAAHGVKHVLFYTLSGYIPAALSAAKYSEVCLFSYTIYGDVTVVNAAARDLLASAPVIPRDEDEKNRRLARKILDEKQARLDEEQARERAAREAQAEEVRAARAARTPEEVEAAVEAQYAEMEVARAKHEAERPARAAAAVVFAERAARRREWAVERARLEELEHAEFLAERARR